MFDSRARPLCNSPARLCWPTVESQSTLSEFNQARGVADKAAICLSNYYRNPVPCQRPAGEPRGTFQQWGTFHYWAWPWRACPWRARVCGVSWNSPWSQLNTRPPARLSVCQCVHRLAVPADLTRGAAACVTACHSEVSPREASKALRRGPSRAEGRARLYRRLSSLLCGFVDHHISMGRS